tara:strand:- start:167594 stop:168433 length:840 start_codon:yes stop_codon:yes gene_type:complete
MIESGMLNRTLIRDWVLLFICGWVIAHANWPAGVPVRTITYWPGDGTVKQTVVSANDPRVAILKDRIRRWDQIADPTPLVVAKWRRELADFYCQSGIGAGSAEPDAESRPQGPLSQTPVRQVSFTPDGNRVLSAKVAESSDTRYWRTVRDRTDAWIHDCESVLAAKRMARGAPPAQLGPILAGPVGMVGNFLSALIAAMMATGFCLWSLTCPSIELNADEHAIRRSRLQVSADRAVDTIAVGVPARWVRVHQPVGVKLRSWSFAALVMAAIATQLNVIL